MTKGFLRIRTKRCLGTLKINKLPKIEGTVSVVLPVRRVRGTPVVFIS
jgi:hypothetical protein